MALLGKHRNSIHNKLAPLLGEEDTQALLDEFPTRQADEPITKDYLRAELALTRTELRGEIADLRTEVAHLGTRVERTLRRQFAAYAGILAIAVGIVLRAG